jgi:hypothetical protein
MKRTLKKIIPSLWLRLVLSPIMLVVFIVGTLISLLVQLAGESERSLRIWEYIVVFFEGE